MQYRMREFPRLFTGGAYLPNTLLIADRLVREEFLMEVSAVAALSALVKSILGKGFPESREWVPRRGFCAVRYQEVARIPCSAPSREF
jgi:hypothetical protein